MYKDDLALNNLQWLICHKTTPNLIRCTIYMEDNFTYEKKIIIIEKNMLTSDLHHFF